jgi:signal transduction histidine kinase
MSFRTTLFWGIAVTVVGLVALEALFDILADRLGHALPNALGALLLERPLWVDLIDLPVFVGIAFLASHLLADRLVRPLRALTAAAEALASDPTPLGIPEPSGDDEFASLGRALHRMSASVHTLLERERSFTRYASHELRTPVSALRMQLERVELGTATAAEVLPALQRQVERIEELLTALLTLARSREHDVDPMPIEPLVLATFDQLPEALRRRVYVVQPMPDLRVTAAALVQQALRNLIDNAVRHGDGPATVEVEADERTLTLRVSDIGPGIPATELRGLADPEARRPARPDGHGLGLTLVALIARALDGRLLLRNTEIGLEATLSLEVVIDQATPADDGRQVAPAR